MRMFVIVLVAIICTGIGVSSAAAATYAVDGPVEWQLAIIQRNEYVAPNDPLVFRFARVLDRLEYRCQETRMQLGSIDVALVDNLTEQGIYSTTLLLMLQGLDQALPYELFGPDHPANCGEFLAVLATLASEGD